MDRNEVVTIVSFIGELAQLLSGASKSVLPERRDITSFPFHNLGMLKIPLGL